MQYQRIEVHMSGAMGVRNILSERPELFAGLRDGLHHRKPKRTEMDVEGVQEVAVVIPAHIGRDQLACDFLLMTWISRLYIEGL
jgi:hypothetical protein